MANLQEVVSWEAGIYQLEIGDPVLGGPGGISNKQAQALANRTAYLKKHVDDIEGGNTAAGKADKLSAARNIALAGDITGQAAFDGSGNITITATYKNSGVTAGTYRSVTVDAKGNITSGTNPTTLEGYGITDAVPNAQKGAANGVATLDGNGKLPVSQVPATAIVDTFVVNTQAAMLALTAEVGDLAVRTDLNKSFILRVAGAATLANWQELLTPTDSVQSVDGMTGAVTIATASEAVKGKAQIATQAEVNAGTDDTKFVTSKKLMAWVKQASETITGFIRLATQAEIDSREEVSAAVRPHQLREIAVGQRWTDMLLSRAMNTVYTNSTGKPIALSVTVQATGVGASIQISIDGVAISRGTYNYLGQAPTSNAAIIPAGSTYSVALSGGTGSISVWYELR